MKTRLLLLLPLFMLILAASGARAQVQMTGRTWGRPYEGSTDVVAYTAITCFASLNGSGSQSCSARTWETDPSGWYLLSGGAGNYSVVFSNPAHFMRPVILNNIFTRDGDIIERKVFPPFDLANHYEGAWDNSPATDYYQTFTAKGTSVTSVGFKLATDGVDGEGPQAQHLVLSIHRKGPGTPDTWEQVGPSMPVLSVNCGGSVNMPWSAGWNSGEVPTTPGETYAVRVSAEIKGNSFQAFWRPDEDAQADCYRVGADGAAFQKHDLWMAVASDSDGLFIPYNKRVHKQFHDLSRFGPKWSQTWVAQGRGLASVVWFAAVADTQPWLVRQRALVRVRKGGPEGPVVGIEKIAIGQSTATAFGGAFGVAFAPGEVELDPGETYALEMESYGADGGFNPVRKHPPDEYVKGEAYFNGTEKVDYDLDMQIIEYAHSPKDWTLAMEDANLLKNGDMQAGKLTPGQKDSSRVRAWKRFAVDPMTSFWYQPEAEGSDNRIASVVGGSINDKTVDGGYVQAVTGLDPADTFRLSGRVRCSQPVDAWHQCLVGWDATGQTADAQAKSIHWDVLPGVHDTFVSMVSDPIRPATGAISVWLRGKTISSKHGTFIADFDDIALKRVKISPPDEE